MKPLSECRLYTFVDTAYLDGRDPVSLANALCKGGSDVIQLRAKGMAPEIVAPVAQRILSVTRNVGVRLVINDHWQLAQELGAEVCHLGQEDFFAAGWTTVDSLRGRNQKLEVGLSTHAPEQAFRAMAAGADYLAVGPIWATGTKPTATPVTLDYVRWAAANVDRPWFAIGGIHLDNLRDVLQAGATRVCVVSAILRHSDITSACQAFRTALDSFPMTR